MNISKALICAMMLATTASACTLVNISVEPAVTQFYSAGFQIHFTSVTSSDWKNEIDVFILRSEDNMPIEELYQYPNENIKYSIPDNGNVTTGFFYVNQNYVVGKEYIFWVQACQSQQQQTFVVSNQYGWGDQAGSFIQLIKNNIFYLLMAIVIVVLIVVVARPLIQK